MDFNLLGIVPCVIGIAFSMKAFDLVLIALLRKPDNEAIGAKYLRKNRVENKKHALQLIGELIVGLQAVQNAATKQDAYNEFQNRWMSQLMSRLVRYDYTDLAHEEIKKLDFSRLAKKLSEYGQDDIFALSFMDFV